MVLRIFQPESGEVSCRSCGQSGLIPVLALGCTPLASALLTADELQQPEEFWPLELVRCEQYSLVQITETVPPEKLFREYAYFSSFSDTMVAHARAIAERMMHERKLTGESLVAEVASNDGYLPQWYHRNDIPVLGIEPAENIAEVAERERGVRTVSEFFGLDVARKLAGRDLKADVIHANNVLAHVADLNGVVAGFAAMLKENGRVVVEVPYLRDLLDNVEFDTIYHEHLCYFSLTALDFLFSRHGLQIVDVERLSIHGGSLRIFAAHQGECQPAESFVTLLNEESGWVFSEDVHRDSSRRVETLRESLLSVLRHLKSQGKRIAVYGASAKGSMLMNYFGIGADEVDYVVDRSTVKQGRFTPGTHLKIFDTAVLNDDRPDYCLLLTWNFADEILSQQRQYRANGGRFIIPVPDVRISPEALTLAGKAFRGSGLSSAGRYTQVQREL